MKIEALDAYLVDPQRASRISVPAFDSLTEEARRALRLREPLTWLHAMQPPEEHESIDAAMAASAAAVDRLMQADAFLPRPRPTLYLYRLSDGSWSQTGVVADVSADQFSDGTVLPHEGTRPDQVHQLVRHLEIVGVSSSPLAVAYRSTAEIAGLVAEVQSEEPLLAFDSTDGLHQEVWELPPRTSEALVRAFESVEHAYITDGHHRARAAVEYASERGPNDRLRASRVLTVLFPHDHLKIVEFNRVVHEVPDPKALQRTLADWGARPVRREAAHPARPGQISVWVSGFWYSVDLPRDEALQPPESLDPAVLQDRLLGPVLGIANPATDSRIEYVPGSVALNDLEHRARSGAAFVMAPVSLDDMMLVSDAGGRMPPKSTYFEPKVRSGIFLVRR